MGNTEATGRAGRGNKLRTIRPDRQFDAQLGRIRDLLIVLRQPLANFPRRDTHHGIRGRIVIRVLAEDIDGNRALLQFRGRTAQLLFHHVAQKRGIPLAVAKRGA